MEYQGSDRFEQLKQMYAKEDLGACFANLHLKIEGDIHKVKEDVAGLKARTEHLENFATESELAIRTINDTSVPALQKAIADSKDELSNELTKLEMWGRKWNVIIRGIPGSANEGGRVTLTKVTEFFKNTLKAILQVLIYKALYDKSCLGSKTTKTSGEWTCLISFATAPLTCSERGGCEKFKMKIYVSSGIRTHAPPVHDRNVAAP